MDDTNVLVQDVLVTLVAVGAMGWLVQRVAALVTPSKSRSCQGCTSCQRDEAPARRRPHTDGIPSADISGEL